MQEAGDTEEEMKQQQRMKIMTGVQRNIKATGRMDANNSWWVSELLPLIAKKKKTWLHPLWKDTMQQWYRWLHEMMKDEEQRKEEEHRKLLRRRSARAGGGRRERDISDLKRCKEVEGIYGCGM